MKTVKDFQNWIDKIRDKYPDIDNMPLELCTDVLKPRMQVADKVQDFAVGSGYVVLIGSEIPGF